MDDRLQLTISGQDVQGRFLHRSDSFIEVEIVAPYSGFRDSLHMASFSRAQVPRGFRGDEGESSGRKILRQLFKLCSYIERNRAKLLDAYLEYVALERQLPLAVSDEWFVALKESMKSSLESGDITEEEYQRRITESRLGHSRYHEQKYLLQQEFFKMHFPLAITPNLQTQVLGYLWREIHASGDRSLGGGEISPR
jgi:hypothetical protein